MASQWQGSWLVPQCHIHRHTRVSRIIGTQNITSELIIIICIGQFIFNKLICTIFEYPILLFYFIFQYVHAAVLPAFIH